MAPSVSLLFAAVVAVVLSSAAAQTYSGPLAFSAQDVNPGHTPAACTTSAGCVPITVTLSVKETTPFAYTLALPSGKVLSSGSITGSITLSLTVPWGKYPVMLTLGAKVVTLAFTVTGFTPMILPAKNAFASDAKYGIYNDLRWSYYALQQNNSKFTPGVEQQFWTGSATHYHQNCYWHLALDPAFNNTHELVSFAQFISPYYANGTANNEGALLNLYPSRTTNNHFNVTIGDAPFYTGPQRKMCTLVGTDPRTPNWPANVIYKCDPTFLSKFLVATATQIVDPSTVKKGDNIDDYATHLALHYVQYYAPFYPVYAAASP